MKKTLFILLIFTLVLVGCGSNESTKKGADKNEIEVDEQLSFLDFSVIIKNIKIYEKEGQKLVDLNMDWINDSFPDKTTFLRAASLDVYQGDDLLSEVSGAWQDKYSDVYFPNAQGGKTPLRLTYELVNDSDLIKLVFVVHDENDNNKEITIEIEGS